MPIISTIGRRHWKVRLLIGAMYGILTLGGISMVYPFLLMVAGSTKSNVDTPASRIIPEYLCSEVGLFRKFAESFFNESGMAMSACWNTGHTSFRLVDLPDDTGIPLVADWEAFLQAVPLPVQAWTLAYMDTVTSRRVMPENLRAFRRQMIDRFGGDLAWMHQEMGTKFQNWSQFKIPVQVFSSRRVRPLSGAFAAAYQAFAAQQPLWQRYYFSADGFYARMYLKSQYTSIEAYNAAHGTRHRDWGEIRLAERAPADGRERSDWMMFVRTILNLYWIRMDAAEAPRYRAYLQAKYLAIQALNRNYGTDYLDFGAVPFFTDLPSGKAAGSDWNDYLIGWTDPGTGQMHQAAAEALSVETTEILFRRHLQHTYGSLEAINAACGTHYASWMQIYPPQQALHYRAFAQHRNPLRLEFSIRNFIPVIDTVLLRGRAIFNTAVYCLLAIGCALIINPLAAYGLSRYKPPSAYKVLLFMMLTMAFPPMVTQIPNFLLLRELNLLNTFWALILPGMANGYSIFLLKGFFDSLPAELYEAAEIDGASEFRIFWQITMSLSKPILAVISLNAFTLAYSNFMMALLVCQDDHMWTIMPWLYQLQQQSSQGIVYASLLIAAVPTFIVFAFCQKVIIRGIVVPVEK